MADAVVAIREGLCKMGRALVPRATTAEAYASIRAAANNAFGPSLPVDASNDSDGFNIGFVIADDISVNVLIACGPDGYTAQGVVIETTNLLMTTGYHGPLEDFTWMLNRISIRHSARFESMDAAIRDIYAVRVAFSDEHDDVFRGLERNILCN
jgi:hypothetical protein